MTVRAVFRRTVGAQWPILLVGSIFAVGFVLAGANFWRRGALLIGIGVGVAAVLRLVLSQHPDHRLTAMLGTHGKGLAA